MTLRNESLLKKLADYLETIDHERYDIGEPGRDALYHAAQMKDFQRIGVKYAHDKVTYKGHQDLDAAMALFGLDSHEAQHLFGKYQVNEWGERMSISPFGGGFYRGKVTGTSKFPTLVAGEPPAYTANRIRSFIINYDQIRTAKDSAQAVHG